MEYTSISEASQFICARIMRENRSAGDGGKLPEGTIGMVLGSGLGTLGDEIEDPVYIDYAEIPHFPVSMVPGHKGRLAFGRLSGRNVLIMQGRTHWYEGYSMKDITFAVRVMRLAGIADLLVTNAAGGVNTGFKPGDLMLITDHIRFFSDNPLRGANLDEFGPRFNDMSYAYTPELQKTAALAAEELGMDLKKGVYAFMSGPCFETPAEIRMLRTLGADAVGMSTVPEVIVAAHCGMRILGISCISNMAAGILDQPLNHEEVMETGDMVKSSFLKLVKAVSASWPV